MVLLGNNHQKERVIQASRGVSHIDVAEIWKYRELLYFLTWRDIKVKYKQTLIGITWVLLQPLLSMVVFTILFGKLAHISSEGIPYPLFVLAGLVPWTYFSQSLSNITESMVSSSALIKDVYLPRILIPIASSLSALVDLLISFVSLIFLMFYYHYLPSREVLLLPILLLLLFICSVGIGFWLSALNVLYRDVRYIVPFFIQLAMFATPVIYPTSIVLGKFQWLLYLNPLAGIIESFRAVLLNYKSPPLLGLLFSFFVCPLFFISGMYFFRKLEKRFADFI